MRHHRGAVCRQRYFNQRTGVDRDQEIWHEEPGRHPSRFNPFKEGRHD